MGAYEFQNAAMRRKVTGGWNLIHTMLMTAAIAFAAADLYLYYKLHEAAILADIGGPIGIGPVGAIRNAMRVYAATHNGAYPALTDADGEHLGMLGINSIGLKDRYATARDFKVTSTPTAYTITYKDRKTGRTYVMNEKGEESGTYRIGN